MLSICVITTVCMYVKTMVSILLLVTMMCQFVNRESLVQPYLWYNLTIMMSIIGNFRSSFPLLL